MYSARRSVIVALLVFALNAHADTAKDPLASFPITIVVGKTVSLTTPVGTAIVSCLAPAQSKPAITIAAPVCHLVRKKTYDGDSWYVQTSLMTSAGEQTTRVTDSYGHPFLDQAIAEMKKSLNDGVCASGANLPCLLDPHPSYGVMLYNVTAIKDDGAGNVTRVDMVSNVLRDEALRELKALQAVGVCGNMPAATPPRKATTITPPRAVPAGSGQIPVN